MLTPAPRHASAATSSGMKTAVFFIQNQTTLRPPLSHPNSQPKNCPALTADSRVAHSICGAASADATAANASQGRHTVHTPPNVPAATRSFASPTSAPATFFGNSTHAPCINTRHAPISIITTKLCACTSGRSPATKPAATIGRKAKGERQKAKPSSAEAPSPSAALTAFAPRAASRRAALPFPFFFVPARRLSSSADKPSPASLAPFPIDDASHQSVQMMSASATPSRMLRCVTKSAVTALPQR
ncbi:MAG: hypothetical protein ABR603_00185 [Pyrinomonadaceae bacterium]